MEKDTNGAIEDEFVEIPETYTTVDLGIFSGFKFGVGFALGAILVLFLASIFFGALFVGLLNEMIRSFS